MSKYRLTDDETGLLLDALLTASRHYAFLAREADVLGEPMYGVVLAERSRDLLSLASSGQRVTRVTVRYEEPTVTFEYR